MKSLFVAVSKKIKIRLKCQIVLLPKNVSCKKIKILKEGESSHKLVNIKLNKSKIISRRYKESQKRKHERNVKYDFSKEILPSLKQVFTLLIN